MLLRTHVLYSTQYGRDEKRAEEFEFMTKLCLNIVSNIVFVTVAVVSIAAETTGPVIVAIFAATA